jgi:hypothetical protein
MVARGTDKVQGTRQECNFAGMRRSKVRTPSLAVPTSPPTRRRRRHPKHFCCALPSTTGNPVLVSLDILSPPEERTPPAISAAHPCSPSPSEGPMSSEPARFAAKGWTVCCFSSHCSLPLPPSLESHSGPAIFLRVLLLKADTVIASFPPGSRSPACRQRAPRRARLALAVPGPPAAEPVARASAPSRPGLDHDLQLAAPHSPGRRPETPVRRRP